jgi:two-component system, OmpR family, response regulator protein BraR/BceR
LAAYKIMIVEDDQTIAGVVQNHLAKWGYSAYAVQDFSDVLTQFQREEPHLVLMDISLPRYNGFYWCGEIRKISRIPILFLSSHTENMDIVMAISMGGDDYITKPFDLSVLIAKVQALLRRSYDFQGPLNTLVHREAVFHIGDGTLHYRGQKIDLTRNEARIMQMLLENKGNTVSRDALIQKLWDSDEFIDDNTLTVNVARLRKKLEDAELCDFIITKKGIGYLVEAQS